MPFWRLFYHLVWATRGREALIDAAAAQLVQRSLRATCQEHRVIVHAIGVMPDHVHIAVSIPPSIAISTFVGRMKGSASHLLNHASGKPDDSTFGWQAEYGVFTFGERSLPDIVASVDNQPAYHAANRLWPAFEQDGPCSAPGGAS